MKVLHSIFVLATRDDKTCMNSSQSRDSSRISMNFFTGFYSVEEHSLMPTFPWQYSLLRFRRCHPLVPCSSHSTPPAQLCLYKLPSSDWASSEIGHLPTPSLNATLQVHECLINVANVSLKNALESIRKVDIF